MPHATVKAHSAKFLKNRLGSFIAKSTLSVALGINLLSKSSS